MSSRMTPERATIRGVVRTAVHGQAVTCCVRGIVAREDAGVMG